MSHAPKFPVDRSRIGIFVSFAFAVAWLVALVIYRNGGLVNSPVVVPGTPITLALLLLAVPYMWAPALAHLATRLITREGWTDLMLRPRFRQSGKAYLIAWFAPGILTIIGAVAYFLLFPQHFDSQLTNLRALLGNTPIPEGFNLWLLVVAQLVGAMLISPLANSIATFGEEFGWRGYLLPKLLPLGWRKAVLTSGVIWGVWHWPVIWMGYEYGFDYPGSPWIGPLLFLWIAICFGTLLSWVTVRSRSVWPAVIGHAAINGIAAFSLIFLAGTPNPLLGPLPVGIVGSIGYSAVALWLLRKKELPHHDHH